MKLMVVGGGGREHALIKALKKSPEVEIIYALPGNAGIARDAVCVPIGAKDIPAIVDFAVEKNIDFAVVAPDDPLALGAVDALHNAGVPCFGPDAKAARIESSKVFSKNLMRKYGIPTADFAAFSDMDEALSYAEKAAYPLVVKADGLALGKGVAICETREDAQSEIRAMMSEGKFGKSGANVVLESFMTGPEVSVLSFTDGHVVVPMVSSMDHKRAHDGDEGLNTGGMGTIAPNPYYTPEIAEQCMREIFLPTIDAMRREGSPFKGCLYFGLMLTPDGPKVVEYNCRFGDPETQVVIPLLKTDLFAIMRAVENETLADLPVAWKSGAACCVMIASGGYPGSYEKGKKIDLGASETLATVYHSGTARDADGSLVSAGGRVLGVTATADTLENAIRAAYRAADEIHFDGAFMRRDIGARALKGV